MADLILPDSRFEHPELFSPDALLTEPVKINWDDPITEGLSSVIIPIGNSLEQHDLVTGGRLIPTSSSTELAIAHTEKGYCLSRTNHATNNSWTFEKDPLSPSSDDGFAQMFMYRQTTLDGFAYDNMGGHGLTLAFNIRAGGSGYFRHEYNSRFRLTHTHIPVLNEWLFSALTHTENNIRHWYVNGVWTDDTSDRVNEFSTINVIGDSRTRNRCPQGDWAFVYQWTRNLTDDEIYSLEFNPKRFIIPE